MNNNDLELFKQALRQASAEKIEETVNQCTEEIVCTKEHELAMKEILRGKNPNRKMCLKAKRLITILVAAILIIMTSCAIIYRHKIRDFIENNFGAFSRVTYSEGYDFQTDVNNLYELTYLPEGYSFNDTITQNALTKTKFSNGEKLLFFEQRPIDATSSYLDVENGYTKMVEIERYDVYYRTTGEHHCYLWNDGDYSLRLLLNFEMDTAELQKIIDGVKVK